MTSKNIDKQLWEEVYVQKQVITIQKESIPFKGYKHKDV